MHMILGDYKIDSYRARLSALYDKHYRMLETFNVFGAKNFIIFQLKPGNYGSATFYGGKLSCL